MVDETMKEAKEDIERDGREDIGVSGTKDIEVEGKDVLESGKVDRVFVYGSLMEGFWNHTRVLEGKVDILGRGTVRGSLYHLREGYPALLAGEDDVVGEVYGPVDNDLLRHLDYLENYVEGCEDNLYDRHPVNVRMSDGSSVECWIYFYAADQYAQENGIYLPQGDWRAYMSGREA